VIIIKFEKNNLKKNSTNLFPSKESVKLEDIAEILSGAMIVRNNRDKRNDKLKNQDNDYKYFPLKAVTKNNINLNHLEPLESCKDYDKKYFAKKDDIIMKLTPPYEVAIFPEDVGENIVISSKFAIIRVFDDEFLPIFLSYILNSNKVKNQIYRLVEGSFISVLKIHYLKNLVIDKIEIEKQKKFAELLFLLNQRKEILIEKIKLENDLAEFIINNFITIEKR
jgi:restriction endonuclease S subunit